MDAPSTVILVDEDVDEQEAKARWLKSIMGE